MYRQRRGEEKAMPSPGPRAVKRLPPPRDPKRTARAVSPQPLPPRVPRHPTADSPPSGRFGSATRIVMAACVFIAFIAGQVRYIPSALANDAAERMTTGTLGTVPIVIAPATRRSHPRFALLHSTPAANASSRTSLSSICFDLLFCSSFLIFFAIIATVAFTSVFAAAITRQNGNMLP